MGCSRAFRTASGSIIVGGELSFLHTSPAAGLPHLLGGAQCDRGRCFAGRAPLLEQHTCVYTVQTCESGSSPRPTPSTGQMRVSVRAYKHTDVWAPWPGSAAAIEAHTWRAPRAPDAHPFSAVGVVVCLAVAYSEAGHHSRSAVPGFKPRKQATPPLRGGAWIKMWLIYMPLLPLPLVPYMCVYMRRLHVCIHAAPACSGLQHASAWLRWCAPQTRHPSPRAHPAARDVSLGCCAVSPPPSGALPQTS